MINEVEESLEIVIGKYNEIWQDFDKMESNLEQITTILKTLLSTHPDEIPLLINLGAVLSDKGMHEEALTYLEKAEKLGSNDANLFMNIGIVKMNISSERSSAKKYFEKSKKYTAHRLTIEAYFDPQGC